MEHLSLDDCDIPLREGLDLDDLRLGQGQEFEIDDSRMQNNTEESDYMNFCKEGYKYFGEDFCTEDDEGNEQEDNPMDFEKIAMKMVNLTSDGGVKKQIILQGVGEPVMTHACVNVHYNGYREFGDEPFDSTYMRQSPYRFSLGTGMVIPGLEIGVASMRKGEKARFLIKSDYGLGDLGCPPRIPGKATLLYVVELLNFSEGEGVDSFYCLSKREKAEAPFDQILKVVNHERSEAKRHFNDKRYIHAGKAYKRAVEFLDNYHLKTEDEEITQQKQLLKLYQNLAVTMLKQSNLHQVIKFSNEALRIDSNCTKALYLKGKALRMLGEFQPALKELERAYRLQPSCSDIAKELVELEKQKKTYDDFEKICCQRMFGHKTSSGQSKNSETSNISEDFKKVVLENLQSFKNDPELMECPFSTNAITLSELRAIAELARSLELHVTSEKLQDNITHIRVCKKLPP